MWHFMQGTCYKVLRLECPEWDFHQLRKAAKNRFREILMSTPSIGSYRENSLKKNLVGGMVWFAIYETAKERYGIQMSLPLYEKMCRASISMPMMPFRPCAKLITSHSRPWEPFFIETRPLLLVMTVVFTT